MNERAKKLWAWEDIDKILTELEEWREVGRNIIMTDFQAGNDAGEFAGGMLPHLYQIRRLLGEKP